MDCNGNNNIKRILKEDNMVTIKTATAEDAWKMIVKQVMKNGIQLEDERDSVTKELLNVVVVVEEPSISKPPEGYFWSGEKLKRYKKQFLDPEGQGFAYTYGNRLREHFGFKVGKNIYRVKTDQIEAVIKRLRENKTTRRATMTAFDPSIDHYQDEIPCMILVDFKIRKNKLYTTALWRSQDIYGAWIPNFFGLSGLADHVAGAVKVTLGPITIHSISAHIYETNFKDASRF
jgi:thymidylate synthase